MGGWFYLESYDIVSKVREWLPETQKFINLAKSKPPQQKKSVNSIIPHLKTHIVTIEPTLSGSQVTPFTTKNKTVVLTPKKQENVDSSPVSLSQAIEDLGADVWSHIASFLTAFEVLKLSATSRKLRDFMYGIDTKKNDLVSIVNNTLRLLMDPNLSGIAEKLQTYTLTQFEPYTKECESLFLFLLSNLIQYVKIEIEMQGSRLPDALVGGWFYRSLKKSYLKKSKQGEIPEPIFTFFAWRTYASTFFLKKPTYFKELAPKNYFRLTSNIGFLNIKTKSIAIPEHTKAAPYVYNFLTFLEHILNIPKFHETFKVKTNVEKWSPKAYFVK